MMCWLRSRIAGGRRVKIYVRGERSGRVTVSSKERLQSKGTPERGIRL